MNHPISFPFMLPVDSTQHPEYKDVVKTPMSLKQVESNLECGTYDDDDDEIKFIQDMKLIFRIVNCTTVQILKYGLGLMFWKRRRQD